MNNISKQLNDEELRKFFLDNEIKSNILIAKIEFIFAILIFIYIVLLCTKLFGAENFEFKQIPLLGTVCLINILNSIVTFIYKGKGQLFKFFNIFGLIISISLLNLLFSYMVVMVLVFPVVLSSRYFISWFTKLTSAVNAFLWFITTFIGEYFDISWIDLNFYELPFGTILEIKPPDLYESIISLGIDTNVRMAYVLEKFLIFLSFYLIIAIISVGITECGRMLIYRIAQDNFEKTRLSTELNVASKIQIDMLPNSSELKPENNGFSLAASMSAAKEVGGDFYDFFYIDEKNLALIIADVSGKGIPAALFMANAKTLIKSITINNNTISTSDIINKVNKELCDSNDEGYFVTVWMGIINIKTGEGIATNAGHENPIIKRKNNQFEIIKYKHSIALGVFDGATFEEHTFKLNKEDILIVYTDGIPEAINLNKEQFGENRIIKTLNSNIENNEDAQNIINNLNTATKNFANGAEQSDDITILCYKQEK